MRASFWEVLAGIAILAICLAAGIVIAGRIAPQPVIGVLRLEGAIDFVSADHVQDVIDAARRDGRVAGVVLEIASPGGFATSSESIFYSLLQLRDEKPLVTAVDGIAVSGGYYIAAAGNQIFAPASSYVGNIGTRGPRPQDPTISPDELSSGPYKLSGGNRFDRIHQLDLVKDAFVSNVVHQRANASVNPLGIDANAIAEARIYLGSEAVAVGLVDAEGGRSDAIQAVADLAGVESYAVRNLDEYLGIMQETPPLGLESAVKSMVEQAPPDAVYLLDSRIALPDLAAANEVERHLLRLRAAAPGSLSTLTDAPAPIQAPGFRPQPAGE
ncbi:MAG: S49 family peptidase [Caldilineaceae bacterium]|nr:S49 family peptidase [Caldilineaceae bacterium]